MIRKAFSLICAILLIVFSLLSLIVLAILSDISTVLRLVVYLLLAIGALWLLLHGVAAWGAAVGGWIRFWGRHDRD